MIRNQIRTCRRLTNMISHTEISRHHHVELLHVLYAKDSGMVTSYFGDTPYDIMTPSLALTPTLLSTVEVVQ